MRFIFVRHPQTIANYQNRLTGIGDSPYTKEGQKQAEAIIKFLSTTTYDKIYSSPIERSRYIGKSVADNLKAELHIAHWLREINFGDFEGLSIDELKERNIDIDKYRKNLMEFQYPNGDRWRDFYENRKASIEMIKNEEGNCLCTSHGGAIWALSTALLDGEMKFEGAILNNASILIIDYCNGKGRIVKKIEIDDILEKKIITFNYLEEL